MGHVCSWALSSRTPMSCLVLWDGCCHVSHESFWEGKLEHCSKLSEEGVWFHPAGSSLALKRQWSWLSSLIPKAGENYTWTDGDWFWESGRNEDVGELQQYFKPGGAGGCCAGSAFTHRAVSAWLWDRRNGKRGCEVSKWYQIVCWPNIAKLRFLSAKEMTWGLSKVVFPFSSVFCSQFSSYELNMYQVFQELRQPLCSTELG